MNRKSCALAMLALAAMVVMAGAPAAFGQDAATSDRMNQLESMVKAQQEQIGHLQQQLAQQGAAGVEQMRVEEIKRVVQELFRDPQFRDQLPLNAGYDNGFFIRSGQDFMLRINGLMQVRYLGYFPKNDKNLDHGSKDYDKVVDKDRSGLELNRARIAFSGFAWDPNMSYRFEITADDTDQVSVLYGWVNYKFIDAFQLRAGLFTLPYGRQENVNPAALQFCDRSLADELFNTGRSVAVMAHGNFFDRRVDYGVALSNGFKNNEDPVNNPDATNALDTNPGITARTVWHALYDQLGKDFLDESDLSYHKKPALDFGASFAWNKDNGDARDVTLPYVIPHAVRNGPGAYGLVPNAQGNGIIQGGLDAAFKYLGFSTTVEYFLRGIDSDSDTSAWALATGNTDNTTSQQGGYWQAGYFIIPQKLEVVGRIGGVWDFNDDNMWEYTGGVNYYIRGHNLKLQADVTRINELPIRATRPDYINQNDDATVLRVQLQAAF